MLLIVAGKSHSHVLMALTLALPTGYGIFSNFAIPGGEGENLAWQIAMVGGLTPASHRC
jgi:hypothetical protein